MELFGLPGAGKTTITDGLTLGSLVTRKQMSAAWSNKSIFQRAVIAGKALIDLAWMRSIIALVIRTPLTNGESLMRLARLAFIKHWILSQQGNLLFDQGLLQRLWSIFYTSGVTNPPHALLTGLLRQFYQGQDVQIVMIEVPPELAARRVYGRSTGTSRLDKLPENAVRNELENTADLPAALLSAARDAGFSVVTLDGSALPGQLIARLQTIVDAKASRPEKVKVRRISVVGSTGSGKTTFARDLSERLALPFYELDSVRSEPVGISQGDSGFVGEIGELVQNEGWIIDGHYRNVRHLIWQRADLVLHLKYPVTVIIARLVGRYIGKRSNSGSSGGADGGASWARRFNRMAKTIRERREYAKIFDGPDFTGLTVVELRSPKATREWLAGLETTSDPAAAKAAG